MTAPARLHLGFLDLHGGLGRRFGSFGVAIDGIDVCVTLARSGRASSTGPSAERAAVFLERVAAADGPAGPFALTVERAIPEHVGLGSGTQLGLAVAAAAMVLGGKAIDADALAPLVERGARSGIGIGVFRAGGFVVDGGRLNGGDQPAPIVTRLDFPGTWRFVLVSDDQQRGLHGAAETAAFRCLPDFPESLAGILCRDLVMRLLPGLVERRFADVAGALGEIQARVGDYFAPVQGGRFTSPRVAAAIAHARAAGFVGVGQTSWGPTGFVLVEAAEPAQRLANELRSRFDLPTRVVGGRNAGAEIRVHHP